MHCLLRNRSRWRQLKRPSGANDGARRVLFLWAVHILENSIYEKKRLERKILDGEKKIFMVEATHQYKRLLVKPF